MCARAATRELAPGDPLGSRQTVQNWIAESRSAIDAARLLVLHAAWTIDTQGIAAGPRSDLADQVSRRRRDAGGRRPRHPGPRGPGISDDTVLSWFYRQERAARIYDGPDEVHKVVVAKRMLEGIRTRPAMSFADRPGATGARRRAARRRTT